MAAAEQLMADLTGSYQELWPVILADEYKQTWLDNCKELVGEEAVRAYADGKGVYECHFTQQVAKYKKIR